MVTKNNIPQKDKNSNLPSEKNTQAFILPQPYRTRRSPKKKP
jgi:hypothetical protein